MLSLTRPVLMSLVLAITLSGCGFKPLYRTEADDPAISAALAAIEIAPIEDRIGQRVHNELLDRITPLGRAAEPRYILTVILDEERENVALLQDETVTRANYQITARFRLADYNDDTVLLDGSTWAATSFDVVRSDYSTLMAQQAAQGRLAADIAQEIRIRLSIYFGQAN